MISVPIELQILIYCLELVIAFGVGYAGHRLYLLFRDRKGKV